MSSHQQRLFDIDAAPWELDDASELLVARVVLPEGPRDVFDYRVPDGLRDRVRPGRRVRVPLGRSNRRVVGYCVELLNEAPRGVRLKDVQAVVDQGDLVDADMLRLTSWLAQRYLCPWGQVLESVVPAGVRRQAGTRETTLLSRAEAARNEAVRGKLTAKQQRVIDVLAEAEPLPPHELAQRAGCTQAPIRTLRKKGLIVASSERIAADRAAEPETPRQTNLTLSDEQREALENIRRSLRAREHGVILLHGVTGSGKTEVYIQAIQEVVGYGRQAIVLVPEISLTPQTRQRFRERFDRVAVLHSHLSDVDRHIHWKQIAAGEVQVVVGARSAIFAPAPHLGLIVMDEEHESSFKQESAPRYHARDVALSRARALGIPLALGSATPSLESWRRAATGHYDCARLPQRVAGRPLPTVTTIDLRGEIAQRGGGILTRPLRTQMEIALREGGQVILLLNRRGFATHIQCPSCGEVVRCPHCDIALTHHRRDELALCHYCNFQQPPPANCPKCRAPGIRFGGVGTQRLEAEVHKRFPEYKCARMDTDTMQHPTSYERTLAAFHAGEVQILLGTQMIAKGLDFPNVTLVGVVNADTALHLPDFRAAERTFQLLVQVAGRTGRGEKGGRVLVQTFCPEHPAVEAAARHDYAGFVDYELPFRELHGYPPYGELIRIVVRGEKSATAKAAAEQFAEAIRAELNLEDADPTAPLRVLGPAPAPIARLRGKFRFQIHLHGSDGEQLRDAVRGAAEGVKMPDDVQWIADVDPLSML